MRKEILMQNMNRLGVQVAEHHKCVSEFTLVLHNHRILACLEYDIEVLAIWTWGLLRFSASTEENVSYCDNGTPRE